MVSSFTDLGRKESSGTEVNSVTYLSSLAYDLII